MTKTDKGGQRIFWRSLEHKADPARMAGDAAGSDIVKQTVDAGDLLRVNRRNFMTLSSAMAALTGLGGCIRRPEEKILPYVAQPEYVSPGVPLHYATVSEVQGEAVGLLVKSNEGRPTKIEGNPEHPASLGRTSAFTQAEILELYDPSRLQEPVKGAEKVEWRDIEGLFAKVASGNGAGVAVLARPTNSPTFLGLRALVQRKLPAAKFVSYTPVNQSTVLDGGKMAFGRSVNPVYDYSKAKVVLSLDADFLLTEQGAVRSAADFAACRDMESSAGEMNRLYVVEPSMTVTGSNADHRLRLGARQVPVFAAALCAELTKQGVSVPGAPAAGGVPEGIEAEKWSRWARVVAKDLLANRGASAVVVGARQPAALHALGYAVNQALGNFGKTLSFHSVADTEAKNQFADITALSRAMAAGQVNTLIMLGGNPVYDAPADADFAASLAKVPLSITLTSAANETSVASTYAVPRTHELEAWGDQLALTGEYSVQQPLVSPLWHGRSDIEVLSSLAGQPVEDGHALVKTTAESRGHRGKHAWRQLLNRGLSDSETPALSGLSVNAGGVASAASKLVADARAAQGFEVVFLPDNKVFDGRYANNSWLLEMPDPITRIVWDNAALIAPSTAASMGIENGDMVRVTVGGTSVDIVAWKQPGQAPNSIGLPLGWGRSVVGSGGYGYASDESDVERRGFNVYPLRRAGGAGFASATLERTGAQYNLTQTQDHDFMRDKSKEDEDRPLAIDATLAEYKETPNYGQWKAPDPSVGPLWETVDYSKGVQWGMVIDLNTCTGCSACVIACQSENNVPAVGKDQVARGREMHWFRIDRYYVGEDEDEPDVAYQPIGCQHCEEAPCENVCPVMATAHSDEGLNDIAYNRCIGTRYCMNNCPYKVRRFNFLSFNLDVPETLRMQRNPQVSNRFRGVIEKCSYCVQRIQGAKIEARREERELVDGDVKSACQQVCPSGAIAFGDINNPEAEVAKKRAIDRNYGLLPEIGTRPRTRFLGKVRNPNPEMQA